MRQAAYIFLDVYLYHEVCVSCHDNFGTLRTSITGSSDIYLWTSSAESNLLGLLHYIKAVYAMLKAISLGIQN